MKGLCLKCRYYNPDDPKWNCDVAHTIQNIEDRDDVELMVSQCKEYKENG